VLDFSMSVFVAFFCFYGWCARTLSLSGVYQGGFKIGMKDGTGKWEVHAFV
jgi:hypothetical protein